MTRLIQLLFPGAAPPKLACFALGRSACCLLLVALVLASCSKRTELDDSVLSLTFKTLSGEQITVSEIKKPLLVNFWSTSCTICLHEMPELTQLYRDYHPSGFELIAVAMPYDAPNAVVELQNQEQWPFPVALDLQGEAVDSFASVKGTPTSYLIDAEGHLVERYVGAIDIDDLRQRLDRLLLLADLTDPDSVAQKTAMQKSFAGPGYSQQSTSSLLPGRPVSTCCG